MDIPDWMIIDAVRYAIGRQTYQVAVTCRWLVKNWEQLPASVKRGILQDLERAFEKDTRQRSCGGVYGNLFLELGSDMDRREWLAVLNLARCSALAVDYFDKDGKQLGLPTGDSHHE